MDASTDNQRLPLLRSFSDPINSNLYGSLNHGDNNEEELEMPKINSAKISSPLPHLKSNMISFDEFGIFNSSSKDQLSSYLLNKSMKTVNYYYY